MRNNVVSLCDYRKSVYQSVSCKPNTMKTKIVVIAYLLIYAIIYTSLVLVGS